MKTVSINWLAEELRHRSDSVLLLDSRCSEEYKCGCIVSAVNVYCCGALILRRLKKGSVSVESLLMCEEDKEKYSKAKESEGITVVVYDECGSTNGESDSLTSLLLKKLSREVKNVSFLDGGYTDFRHSYSNLCTQEAKGATAALKQAQRPSSLVLQLANLSTVSDESSSSDSSSSDESPSPLQERKKRPFMILPHLYLGCREAASDREALGESGITRVLNVTSEDSKYRSIDSFTYYQIPVEDSHDVDMLQHLPEAFTFIESARLSGEKVIVHCYAGMSRSVTVVLSYLMKFYGHSFNSAYDYVKQIKSNISPNFSFIQQLVQFESSLRTSPADSGIDSQSTSPVEASSSNYSLDMFNGSASSTTSLTQSQPNFRRCILAA